MHLLLLLLLLLSVAKLTAVAAAVATKPEEQVHCCTEAALAEREVQDFSQQLVGSFVHTNGMAQELQEQLARNYVSLTPTHSTW